MDDPFLRRARPRYVRLARIERRTERVDAADEEPVLAQHRQRRCADPRHDPHRQRDVGAVCQLDPDDALVRAERTHAERHHVQRASAHHAFEQRSQRRAHLAGIAPVVRRAGIRLFLRTDEGAAFHSRHVARVGSGEKTVGPLGGIEPDQRACGDELRSQRFPLGVRSFAPADRIGPGQCHHLVHPVEQRAMRRRPLRGRRRIGHERRYRCIHHFHVLQSRQ